jgi:hypothetical protein
LALAQNLAEWNYPQPLYCSMWKIFWPSKPMISWATESLSNFVANWSYKVSKEKDHYATKVTYLGLILARGTNALGEDRIQQS